jgi:prevent-host-death family protein
MAHLVGAFEAKNKLSALLYEVEHGGEVTITRRGKPIAKLVSATRALNHEKAKRAAETIRAMRKGVTLGGLRIKDLIEEGRR